MYLISVLSVTIFVMGTHNLIMIYIYKAKIPFF